jgi:hypothetical protein
MEQSEAERKADKLEMQRTLDQMRMEQERRERDLRAEIERERRERDLWAEMEKVKAEAKADKKEMAMELDKLRNEMQQREMRNTIRELELRVGMAGQPASIMPASQLVSAPQQRLDPARNPIGPVGVREAKAQQTVPRTNHLLRQDNQQQQQRIQQLEAMVLQGRLPGVRVAAAAAAVPSKDAPTTTTVHQSKTKSQAIKPQLPSAKPHPSRTHPSIQGKALGDRRASTKVRAVPLPADTLTHFFLSHSQATGGDQMNAIYLELRQMGFSCWYDNR